ncbi:MAG: SIS domain-containing protein, partial [Planctomycetota bacterium]
MCGIVAYVGNKSATPLLLEGLKRLEYRGYDSAGLAITTPDGVRTARSVGRVSVLQELVEAQPEKYRGALGIAHTRWATHGSPSEANAHPHQGTTKSGHTISLVHNGIIENYRALRTYLEGKGHVFTSETDTEVLAKLIAELYDPAPGNIEDDFGAALETAVQTAMREVTGAYAIAVTCTREPHTLVVARKGSPLIIGIAENAYVVASDPSAIVAHTTQAITLEDYQVARLCAGPVDGWEHAGFTHTSGNQENNAGGGRPWSVDFRTTTIDNEVVSAEVAALEIDLQEIELGGYEHFMLKEIMEQPEAIRTCLRGRVDTREGRIVLGGLANLTRELVRAKRFILSAQGTAYHAGLIGEYLLADLAKVPARAEYASEFRYREPPVSPGTLAIFVSQSGETADTLAALRYMEGKAEKLAAVVNVTT